MGLFDTFFSSVTGSSREPQKPSGVELELRRRLTVLASDEATQDTPLRYFLHWTGQVQGVGFRFTNTNLAQARALTGWVRNMKTAPSRWRYRGLRQTSYLISRRFMPPTSAWGRVFASQTPRPEPHLPMKTVSVLVISIVC